MNAPDEAIVKTACGIGNLLPEDFAANPSESVLVVLQSFLAEPEEEEEDVRGDGHDPQEEEKLALVVDGVKNDGDGVDAPEIGVDVGPVRPGSKAEGREPECDG